MVLYVFISYEVLTFESVKEILRCYHLNETSFAELLHSTIYFLGFYKKRLFLVIFFLWPILEVKGFTNTS